MLWDECRKLHELLVQLAGSDELLRRLCGIPGVGPVTAVTFKAAIAYPVRFAKSKTVGAHFDLTAKRIQSGSSVDHDADISRRGDGEVRTVLYEAASAMMTRSQKHCTLKAWGMRLAAKHGHKRAVVAVARKLAVIMRRMWIDGSSFRFTADGQEGMDGSPGSAAALTGAA